MPEEPKPMVRGCTPERMDELLKLVTDRLPDSVAVTILITPICDDKVRSFTSYGTTCAPAGEIARILRNAAADIEANAG